MRVCVMPKPSDESFGNPADSSLDDDFELDELAVSRKPHFLDYDNKPPAELVDHCWNGAGKEGLEEEEEEEEISSVEEKEQKDVSGRPPLATVVCEQSLLFQRPPTVASLDDTTTAISTMNVSYDVTTATVTTLSILPAVKQGGGVVVNGTRGGGTWPLKDRPAAMSPRRQHQQQQQTTAQQQHDTLNRGELGEVGPKMECVYSLLSMLGSTNVLEMSCKFLELSRNEEKCSALRRSGCVPLLVHIIHNEPNEVARRNARHALVNVVRCNVDEGSARRELKVLRLIDQLIDYTDLLKEQMSESDTTPEANELIQVEKVSPTAAPDPERHPIQAIGTLAKISYDEEHRHAMCQFGALQTIASLIQLDHHVHGSDTPDALKCIEMRRYASMVLTNLTFGQGNNKALLCSNREFMRALVSQLGCTELVQVTASVLRNLSWRADTITKQTLVDIETVTMLTEAAMRCAVENTLKSILSALWNLSNHCAQNRAKICEVSGALEFLIDLLSYEAPSKTWSIVENAGGILRNVSSHIAQCEEYRHILREKQCLKLLLDQLKSPSLTVVSNACGTLGNLSSDNEQDQQFLREHGAIPMLRSLIYSKHNIISNGSRLALKNLQQQPVQRPAPVAVPVNTYHEPDAGGWNGKGGEAGLTPAKPGLNVRKQRAMEQELGSALYRKQSEATDGEDMGAIGRDIGSSPDPEPEPETPINYGLTEERLHHHSYDYQETDIDQLTDYSLRYAENQSDSEDDEEKDDERAVAAYRRRASGERVDPTVNVLMPEDSVKCYYTEGTPQIISSATSMSDLRAATGAPMKSVEDGSCPRAVEVVVSSEREEEIVGGPVMKSNPIPIGRGPAIIGDGDTGCNTPDKPYNYCEEGTPDFSREVSLSIINLPHESQQQQQEQRQQEMEEHQQQMQHAQQPPTATTVVVGDPNGSINGGPVGKSVSFLNTGADETPLMFSRTSSMGSLSSAEPACTDDKSSIVSEFSRMASGVMSPSELPDSPTQTIPHSPHPQTKRPMLPKILPPDDDDGGDGGRIHVRNGDGIGAFADTVSKFNVEHTPAQLSCATSLSNLSLEEKDEIKQNEMDGKKRWMGEERLVEESSSLPSQPPVLPNPADVVLIGMINGTTTNATNTDEGHASDADSDAGVGEDDELLASCISIGMNSVVARSAAKHKNGPSTQLLRCDDATNDDGHDSDDSSNLSDNNDRLLEECILSGMPKPKQSHPLMGSRGGGSVIKENPFKMMRTNDTIAPANDELNPFHIEDSPCNFSAMSVLSDLTMASDTMQDKSLESKDRELIDSVVKDGFPKKREMVVVSSPSVESETDDHLLDEAIAAGITGKMQHGHGDVGDSTKQLLQQNVSYGCRDDPATSNHLPTSHGWMSPPHLSQALTTTNNDSLVEDNDDSEQEEDYQLLVECIQKGMRPVGARGGTSSSQHDCEEMLPLTVGGMLRSSNPTTMPKQTSSHSKNVQTTPAMSKDVGAFEVSPGVGSKTQNCLPSARSLIGGRRRASGVNSPQPTDISDSTDSTTIYFSLPAPSVSNTAATSNSSTAEPATDRVVHERIVVGMANMASAHTALIGSDDLMLKQSVMSEIFDGGKCAKHKNPERMLQSVERLTQELVSQVEERHVRTNTEECSEAVPAVQFKIGEKVRPVAGGFVMEGLNDCLNGGSRVGMMVDDLESEEPPSILYQVSMPFVDHEPIVPSSIDCNLLAPIEEQVTTMLTTTLTTTTTMTLTTAASNRVIKPVRVISNPGSPRTRKLQRESSINKDVDECKGRTIKSQDAIAVRKEQQTKIVKPVVESITKVSRVRQPVPKGSTTSTSRTPTKPSTGSPIHRPSTKNPFSPYAQRLATKKLQPEPTQLGKQKLKPTLTAATGLGIARQDTFVLDKPTLSMHVPKVIPKATTGGTVEPQAHDKPVSKIPLLKGEKANTTSRIPPPKRTLQAGKQQSSKLGALKTSLGGGGGVLKK